MGESRVMSTSKCLLTKLKGIRLLRLLLAAIFSVLLVSGCTRIPIPEQGVFIVKGIPKSMDHISWYRDFCTYGQPVDDNVTPYGDSCRSQNKILHHAYLYKIRLINVKSTNNYRYVHQLYVSMSGGQRVDFNQNNKKVGTFLLQRSTIDFTTATSIPFIATPVFYDKEKNCVGSYGFYPHSDARNCKDSDFHEPKYDACVPLEQVLKHFENG